MAKREEHFVKVEEPNLEKSVLSAIDDIRFDLNRMEHNRRDAHYVGMMIDEITGQLEDLSKLV